MKRPPTESPPVPGWEPIRTKAKVAIPTPDGETIARSIEIEVDAWRDPATGEIYLGTTATDEIDRIKARHMGLFTPTELCELRTRLGLSQKALSELLQIGAKSWTRWETGRERPSRSMNLLIRALHDGRIDAGYLRALRSPQMPTVPEFRYTMAPVPSLMVGESAAPSPPAHLQAKRNVPRKIKNTKSKSCK